MSKGAFQTSREIFNNSIWTDVVKFRIFFYIYGNAVFAKDGVEIAGIRLKRGQFLRSYRNLQKDLEYTDKRAIKQYSLHTIKNKIDALVKENRIEIESTDYGTLFTVVNYEEYQGFERYEKPLAEQQRNSNGTPTEQQRNNNKNVKKDKNDKNIHNNNSEHPAELIQSLYGKFPTGILQSAIADWLQTWPREMLCFAIQTSFDYGKEFNGLKPYINRILENWSTAGIDTLEKAVEANNQFKQRNSGTHKPSNFKRTPKKEVLPEHYVNPPEIKEDPEVQAAIAKRLAEYEARKQKEQSE
jgi:DNA replication protein DnaD